MGAVMGKKLGGRVYEDGAEEDDGGAKVGGATSLE